MANENYALQQAAAQMDSIAEMVAALEVDYDLLEELRGYADGDLSDEDREALSKLESEAGECTSSDSAYERIHPLSVQVRGGWHNPGGEDSPEEFEILLCTGGPAVRIVGDLDEHMQPSRPRLQYQDWGTPWTEYFGENLDRDVLLTYCQQFWFGE